jgi:hypothetical protein
VVQGAYYLATGAWSSTHPASFERFARADLNHFQLSITGSLFMAIGGTLVAGGRESRPAAAAVVLAVLAPLAAMRAEAEHRRDRPWMLGPELAVEAALAGGILAAHRRCRRS